eukprot:Rmarinus@m.23856
MSEQLRFHNYWRSSSSFRVRIAMALKGIDYEYVPVNLLAGEHHKEDFREMNPFDYVPVLEDNGFMVSQSVAILEYLEETHKEVPLLPDDPKERAKVRAIVEAINSSIQPLHNLAVLKKVIADAKAEGDEADRLKTEWASHWIGRGLDSLERMVASYAGKYTVGDSLTLADCCLVPQVMSAQRFAPGLDYSKYPTINRVFKALLELDAVQKAHPKNQPDAKL